MKTVNNITLALLLSITFACNKDSLDQIVQKPVYFRSVASPQWARNASVYAVNVQNYTTEGTFNALARQLPRLQELGVKILWLSSIHPNDQTNYNGIPGSNDATSNFRTVNSNLGTLYDFKDLVRKIHDLDMKVIIDWVPVRNAWDRALLKSNAAYNTADSRRKEQVSVSSNTGDSFVQVEEIQPDYNNVSLRKIMIDDLLFWLQEMEIDGYQCSTGEEVPYDFWLEAVPLMHEVKPDIFLLAETEHPPYRNLELFTATYSWSFYNILNDIATGKKNALFIEKWLREDRLSYIAGYHMNFFVNPNGNSEKNDEKQYKGNPWQALAVLVSTFEGMPFIHREAVDKQVNVFEKNAVNNREIYNNDFYKKLLELKNKNQALWNGIDGGEIQKITVDNPEVFAFYREKNADKVLVIVNLSNADQTAILEHEKLTGDYLSIFDDSVTTLPYRMTLRMKPWAFMVLTRR